MKKRSAVVLDQELRHLRRRGHGEKLEQKKAGSHVKLSVSFGEKLEASAHNERPIGHEKQRGRVGATQSGAFA